MADERAVFLDTSIMIARFVHSPETKQRISARLAQYGFVTTGLVVRYEFRRRLLKEALYLLKQLNRLGSLDKLQRHVHDVLPQQQDRKRRICLQTIFTVYENASDEDRTERAKLFLKSLLKSGLSEFDELVDHVITESGCACGKISLRQKNTGNFDVGPEKCSKVAEVCEIGEFFRLNQDAIEQVRTHLVEVGLSNCSNELKGTVDFTDELKRDDADLRSKDPCLTIGDFLIALESRNVPSMYTVNSRESKRLCRALNQTLIVRKQNPEHDDVVCDRESTDWGEFN